MSYPKDDTPCPKCGGVNFTYLAGDGPDPEKPGSKHYIHLYTGRQCVNCGDTKTLWEAYPKEGPMAQLVSAGSS